MTTSLEPRWLPDEATAAGSNLMAFMEARGLGTYTELHAWSVTDRPGFWRAVVDRLGIVFATPPERTLDATTAEDVRWFPGARLNIVESCFTGDPNATAVVVRRDGRNEQISSQRLRSMAMRFAGGFRNAGLVPGNRVAIAMPMTLEAVVAYLGIVWAGGVVVSIADSFAPEEIATRLQITGSAAVVTQDVIRRGGKTLPMYDKVVAAGAARAIVVRTSAETTLRDRDVAWDDFLGAGDEVPAETAASHAPMNILFSSGTTGEPKAIPWTHLTPIKGAMDGHFHHDIHIGDVVAWPTNLGWMMGPWLIFSSLLNGAAMALYDDVPTQRGFAEFIEAAGVSMLGLVPSLVKAWRRSGCMEGLDWSAVRVMSSTGEASNQSDMAYLMDLAGGKPMIEYCGGTEIGGGYLTATVLEPSIPSTFTTPALGLDLRLLDDAGRPTTNGEVFLVPPSIGLSQELLNRDHHEVYYAGTPSLPDAPILRRHGDHIEQLAGGLFRAHGRIDDTMNLGGIKVSSADIERLVSTVGGVSAAAAIAVEPPEGGPSRLVIVAVPVPGHTPDAGAWRDEMQREIRTHLNPLFKIHEVVVADDLPRTASAKIMRRTLRARFNS